MIYTNSWSQSDNCACCTTQHNAFDFWIGNWEVKDTEGKIVGTNNIRKAQDNCVIFENWESANGTFTGGSTNFFNKRTAQWEQLWVDNSGSHLHLKGNRKDNHMILISDEIPREDKPAYQNKITWTLNEDGTVRQLWEIIANGEVENVVFDGLYSRRSY